jgi:hypothetical protein
LQPSPAGQYEFDEQPGSGLHWSTTPPPLLPELYPPLPPLEPPQ